MKIGAIIVGVAHSGYVSEILTSSSDARPAIVGNLYTLPEPLRGPLEGLGVALTGQSVAELGT